MKNGLILLDKKLKNKDDKKMSENENTKIKLENVRLSFPSIFKRSNYDGKDGKFEATFLIKKDDEKNYKKIRNSIDEKLQEFDLEIPKERWCLKNGDDSKYDGYENCFSLKASNSDRPTLINRDRTPVVEDDNVFYAGCYVNAIVEIWIQNNKFGKRVNCNLLGIQFVKDGDRFGKNNDVTDDFDDIDDQGTFDF